MKKVILLLLIATLISAMILTSCAEGADAIIENEQGVTDDISTTTGSKGEVKFDSEIKPLEYRNSFTDRGMYETLHIGENHYLTYNDFESKQQVFLCSTPNCTHSDESCPAYFNNGIGRGLGKAFASYDNESLFMTISANNADSNTIELTMSEPSGANPQTIFKQENGSFHVLAVGQNNIYLRSWSETQNMQGLLAMNIESGEFTQLFHENFETVMNPKYFPEGDSIYVRYGSVEPGILDMEDPFASPDQYDFKIDRINLVTGETETLITKTMQGDEYIEGVIYSGVYYVNNSIDGDNSVGILNYETGEVEPFADFGDVHQFSSLVSYIEGYFTIVVLEEEESRRYYRHMNIETGEIIDTPYTLESTARGGRFNVEVKILADLGDDLVVAYEETMVQVEVYDSLNEQDIIISNALVHNALISEADYLAGNFNIHPIDNSAIINSLTTRV